MSDNPENVWSGRKVLLTGHTGFKGGWLALWLTQMGAIVCGYSLDPTTTPSLFQAARIHDLVTDIRGDIRDLPQLLAAVQHFEPEVVFHLAAQPLVRRSYVEPVTTYATNVMGTVNLLEAVRQTPSVKAVICVTTDKCYENLEWQWGYREIDRLGGHDPYSNSKACSELVCSAYRDSFFAVGNEGSHVALATARAGNVIGGGDWAEDRLIPDLVRGFLEGDCVQIRNPKAIRPWQHVMEPLRGYIMLAERLLRDQKEFTSAWNFGPREEDAQPVEWIVRHLGELWSPQATWQLDNGQHPHEATYLKLDCARAHNLLGWKPVLRLSEALELIVDWFRAWDSGEDMQQVTLQQIDSYQHLSIAENSQVPTMPVV